MKLEGLSKLANILFAKQLQNIFDLEGTQAITLSLHPGGIKTGMSESNPFPEIYKELNTEFIDGCRRIDQVRRPRKLG